SVAYFLLAVVAANLCRHCNWKTCWFETGGSFAALRQCCKHAFGGDVSHQKILCKWTAAEATDGAVEAAAAGVVGSQDLFQGRIRPAVQMHADLEVAEFGNHRPDGGGNLFGRRNAHGVGQRNGVDIHVRENAHAFDDLFLVPQIAVGIAKSHGDVYHDVERVL